MVGRKGTSGGECYGSNTGSTMIGQGPGFVNSCVHSGSNSYSGGNTIWYNYGAATAGTIVDTSSTANANNINIAAESVCPKGWSLPNMKQIDAIGGTSPGSSTYVSSFSPVLGGVYINGTPDSETNRGLWWTSEGKNGSLRNHLTFNNTNLYTSSNYRYAGLYIRCVSEEKDVSDLTYMQDMTPSILQELCVIVNVLRA